MPPTAGVSDGLAEARAFAESVAGVLGRAETPETASSWVPGEASQNSWPEIDALLDELGWDSLTEQAELAPYAGLAAVELGKQLAPVREVDRLLGGSPLADDLIRTAQPMVVTQRKRRHRPPSRRRRRTVPVGRGARGSARAGARRARTDRRTTSGPKPRTRGWRPESATSPASDSGRSS